MNNELLTNIIKQFIPFAQKQIGFKDPPRLFLRNDAENAKNPFGKTAFYDPEARSVTLYISGRHPKDILRSLGHELVHHKQNCDGQFDDAGDMGKGYAQSNPHLRQMEMDANRDGSMCLRDFEDKLKEENTIYYEHLQKGENKMSTKDWKNKEIGTLISEAWGFKFNSLDEFNEFNGEGELQAEVDDEELDERRTPHVSAKYKDEKDDDSTAKNAPPPPRVVNKGKMEEAEDEGETLDEAEEEELDEQSKSDLADRGAGRAAGGRRLDEEEDEEIDEAKIAKKKKMVKGPDGKMVPDYAADGKGSKDLAKGKEDTEDEDTKKEDLQEAIASLLRKHLRG